MVVLPFISLIHHRICSSFALKCHNSHSMPLNHSRTDQWGISCSRAINRHKHISHLPPGPFLSQGGPRGIFVWILVLPYGKEHENGVSKDKLSSRNTFQVSVPAFRKTWKAAEGRELLIPSLPLFGKSCSKR